MQIRSKLASLSALVLLLSLWPASPVPGADLKDVTQSVGRLLEKMHFNQAALDDELSAQILDTYLELLDYNRLFFTAEDVAEFEAAYGRSLDEAVLSGDLTPATRIHDRYRERVEERTALARKLLEREYAFDSDRTVKLSRREADWPVDEAAARQLWQDRIEAELLEEKLADADLETAVDTVERRYQRLLRNVEDQDEGDVAKYFLTAVAQAYDPHSEYLSPSDLENFRINMQLSLVGIGAMLRSVDGYSKVVDLVPGGPADLSGEVQVNDRITGVAQGDDEFVDVIDMKLDRVVEMIRGEQGSVVRLQVIPADAADPSERREIVLVRDEVELTDQEARAELIEYETEQGLDRRLGWITLPSFYMDMENMFSPDRKSTTRDVEVLLQRLMEEGIEGLIIDLRRNGGGSLEEVVNLTGLFIEQGPVVQAKESRGSARASSVPGRNFLYDGPLVVLTSRVSASASEIFAAALQDYGRAVVVGESSTFGKGTVQQMLELGRYMSLFGGPNRDAGALKLTVQKFYRIAGGSTQLKGVVPDIVLPSARDALMIGEDSLRNPLPYDEVEKLSYNRFSDLKPVLEKLREASEERVLQDPEFEYVIEDMERMQQRLDENRISLNRASREAELERSKARTERRKEERAQRVRDGLPTYAVTLDRIEEPLELIDESENGGVQLVEDGGQGGLEPTDLDPVRDEALHILNDLIEWAPAPKTVKTTGN